MRKVLASLFVSYALTAGQAPPLEVNPIAAATTTTTVSPLVAPLVETTASSVSSTAVETTAAAATTAAPATTTEAPAATATAAATTETPAATATTEAPAATTTDAPATTTAAPATTTTTTAAPETTTTEAPTYYVNPYCPSGQVFSHLGSAPSMAALATSPQAECRSNIPGYAESRAIDYMGELICADWACCLCQEINCGASGYPCQNIKIGTSGAIGVQHIVVSGLSNSLFAGNMNGAQMECSGLEACKFSNIYAHHLRTLTCSGDSACAAAVIQIEPADQMQVQCNGNKACADSTIDIIYTGSTPVSELHSIQFNGANAADGATLVIRNTAAQPLYIDSVECLSPTACLNVNFVIEGDVVIGHCDLLGFTQLHMLPVQLQACMSGQVGGIAPGYVPPGYVPPGYVPAYTPYYLATTTTTQAPAVVVTTPPVAQTTTSTATLPPVVQTQPTLPVLPVIVGDPSGLICVGLECAGRTFEITPAQGWKLECKMNCQGMTVNLNVGGDPLNSNRPTEFLSDIKFLGVNSGAGVTININNVYGVYGAFVEVNDVRCQEFGSCAGLRIFAGTGIDIWSTSFDCQVPGACQGCEVTQDGVTQSCEVMSNGLYSVYNPNVPQYAYNPYVPAWI